MDHARTRGVVFLEAAGIDSTGHIMGTPPGRTLQSSETIKGGVQRRNFEAQNNSKTAVAAMILLEL
jgi:hypothetical protein